MSRLKPRPTHKASVANESSEDAALKSAALRLNLTMKRDSQAARVLSDYHLKAAGSPEGFGFLAFSAGCDLFAREPWRRKDRQARV